MNALTAHPTHPFRKKWLRVLLHLLIVAIALRAALPEAQKVDAAPLLDMSVCSLNSGCPTSFPPPDLLYLNQGGIYTSTPAQYASLKALEREAVSNIIEAHGLSPDDADAVKSWARSDAQAELYGLLIEAVSVGASDRTTDQQNAVDWLSAVAQRQNVKAAEAAGREYVKWAGLDRSAYEQLLMNSSTTESDLTSFLSGTPLNYNNTNPSLATGGWCVYRSPAPYADDYKGYQQTVCSAPSTIITLPPTPSYNDFVKWGEAKSIYPLLTSTWYQSTSSSIALGLSIALPLAAQVAAGIPIYLAAAQYSTAVARSLLGIAEGAATATEIATATTEAAAEASSIAAFSIGAGVALVTTILIALATAIVLGINVTDAANLPGKLAKLIADAKATPPDLTTMATSSDSAKSLYSLFIGVTAPTPDSRTCDNSGAPTVPPTPTLPPGLYPLYNVSTDETTLLPSIPCLNPTDIPPASATDPHFLVKAQNSTTETTASSITWKDTKSGTTTTARLHGNWFITQSNGSAAQALRIAYTDWDSKEQNAWLLGNPTDGYTFVTFSPPADSSTKVDSDTCVANGYCGADASIKYVGADGKKYSATVHSYTPPTGSPTFSTAVEASPVAFNANTFAPGGATGAITYRWRFQVAGCGLISCMSTTVITGTAEPGQIPPPPVIITEPHYSDPVIGPTASYTWQTGGTYQVELKATDEHGIEATTTFPVKVATVPPTLKLYSACPVTSGPCNQLSGDAGTSMTLGATVDHVGTLDNEVVRVNWGDGSGEDVVGGGPNSLIIQGNPLITVASGALSFIVAGTHTYANPGTYYGTVSASDWNGGTASQTFSVTIMGTQAISFAPIGNHSYGDVFSISATGGASGNPVTFSSTPLCALSNVSGGTGTGSATVTVLGAGLCNITASQAGTTTYKPAPSVTQKVFPLLAVLSIKASSPTITYGEPVPAITPIYSGFKLSDTESILTAPATCAVASNSGAAGTYATTCSGAAAPNYSTSYMAGTLTINKAPLSVTANNQTMTYGGAVPSFDAQYSGLVNGDTSAVVSGLSCNAKNGSQAVGSSTPVGSYPISCSGGSAANYSLSYAAGTLTIGKASTSTALSSSASPAVYGQLVTFTASVAVNSPGSGHPGGTVSFKDGSSDIAGCAARPVDAASGAATCTTPALSVAQHSVTASYSGDSNFVGSTAAALTQTVNKAAVTTTLGASTNPSTAGQSVSFSLSVAAAAPGAGVPSGSVTFKDGATTLGSGTLSTSNGAAMASFTASGLSVGQHSISASYSGDGIFQGGASTTLTQYVNTNLSGYPKLPSGAYNLSNLNLTGGYFVNGSLAGASLSGSNLTGAVFLGANLTGANLINTNLKGATLTGATLTGANLTGTNLMGATLTDATLTGANLTGANLTGAIGLKTATVTNITWNKTTCPDGTLSNSNGGTCIGHF